MESLKEFITPKSYNRFSFFVIVLWPIVGTILLGIFAELETSEPRYFNCDMTDESKQFIQGKCLEQYEKRYNKALPVYGFVIINFAIVGIASVLYSIAVKSRVDELDAKAKDMEIESLLVPTRRLRTRQLFLSYCSQLVIKIVLGVTFITLQKRLYPSSFTTEFTCEFPAPTENTSVKKLNGTVSIASDVKNTTSTYACHNQRAIRKTFWASTVWIINVLFVAFALMEGVYLGYQSRQVPHFTTDLTFFESHLMGKNTRWKEFIQGYKNHIKWETKKVQPLVQPSPGEGQSRVFKMDEIYTNMVIYPNRARYEFDNKKRHEILDEYVLLDKRHPIKKPEDIFLPRNNEDYGKPRNILIVGRPGIGKTLLCQKLARDWACDKMFEEMTEERKSVNFEIVFLVKFRRFHSGEKVNVQNLLRNSEYSTPESFDNQMLKYIFRYPEKVLLIFDGFDECHDQSAVINENQYGNNAAELMPLPALYGKLASGKLLSGATVLTTTRPTAVVNVKHLEFDTTVEMLGFTSDQVKEYVERFMNDNGTAKDQVWNHISMNVNVLSLCYVPVNCFIVCSCLQDELTFLRGVNLPVTHTDIYSRALRWFLLKHNPGCRSLKPEEREEFISGRFTPEEVKETLLQLENIALEGTKDGRLIFKSSEVEGLKDCGLLHRLPDRVGRSEIEKQYCFLHLTMQEFLAARELVRKNLEELKAFVSEHIGEGKWQLVIQFVAGLLRDREGPITDVFECSLSETEQIKDRWREGRTFSCWPTRKDKQLAHTLCNCLYEYNKLTKEIIHRVIPRVVDTVDFSYAELTPVDCIALVYVLKNVSIGSSLVLTGNNIGPLGFREICKLIGTENLSTLPVDKNTPTQRCVLHEAYEYRDCRISHLNLARNSITDKGVEYLSEALSKEACKLIRLVLAGNSITDKGVEYLSDALSKEACKLTRLNPSCNSITDKGVEYLSEALSKEACKLTRLDLSSNSITDKGVEYLSEALSKECCKLTELVLTSTSVTAAGVKYMSDKLSQTRYEITSDQVNISVSLQ